METRELLDLAVEAARAAGVLLAERWRGPARGVGTKSTPTDLVSDADRDAERLLVDVIAAARPDDGILGEESGGASSRSGLTWIIDPLDGTVNFLFGIPAWSVSVAVADAEGAVAGVVYDPTREEVFAAGRGEGATLDGAPIRVSLKDDIAMALIGTGFAYNARARREQALRLPDVLPRVRDLRRGGSAALDLSFVACGRLDGFFESSMEPWDKAAGVLLITEAGGRVSELAAPIPEVSPGVVAAGPGIHDALRALVE